MIKRADASACATARWSIAQTIFLSAHCHFVSHSSLHWPIYHMFVAFNDLFWHYFSFINLRHARVFLTQQILLVSFNYVIVSTMKRINNFLDFYKLQIFLYLHVRHTQSTQFYSLEVRSGLSSCIDKYKRVLPPSLRAHFISRYLRMYRYDSIQHIILALSFYRTPLIFRQYRTVSVVLQNNL